jgi:para-nitrobenzyl esterase
MSEDCLVLNIYAPLAPSDRPRPVVVWIHGGAFIMGAGSQPLYDGTSFAANHDIIVVTINYRLGVLGLLYLGDLLGDDYAAGNATLLDQVAALRWVRDNIAAFGGDPAAVTIMGESAGAVSVAHLLATPAARGLYHRAILQSGALGLIKRTREDATGFAKELIAHLGVTARALVDMPADQLIAAQQHITLTYGLGAFSPFVDGITLPGPPLELIRGGAARDIPIIAGWNRDEWMLFDTFLGHATTQLVVAQLRERLGTAAIDRLHAHYRDARADRADARAWVDLVGDMAFRISATQLADAQTAHAPVYMYRFDYSTPMLGAAHALELPFVWNVIDGPFAQLLLGPDVVNARPLATAMHGAWASFIRGGTPALSPAWPTYDTSRRATVLFDRTTTVADDPASNLRTAWDALLA